jgi:hypothetical protein
VQFLQSIRDFPQMVKLGDKLPSFGFNRFKQGLRFTPVDDEGFTLRGDKQRLLYNGRRRSHRFTIHSDTSFEYDCILNKEPDSNVIRLRIDGAENFDFFRQPDFVENPFLKGSYAVYKKQTFLGEGTGKLCHIHRPLIIDARGRRCWGSLAVVGNELQITIPEQWLSEAAYPVVVDPVIGTDTVGSFDRYPFSISIDNSGNEVIDYRELFVLDMILLNKVIVPENIGETGDFYVYKNGYVFTANTTNNTYPCIYSDVNNKPNTKISVNEQEITDSYSNRKIPGWLQAGISKNSSINEGDYIWFGVRGYNLITRFDFGGILEYVNVAPAKNYDILLPDILGNTNYQSHYYLTDECHRNIKVSMYFTYEAALGTNYKKILFQNLNVNDNKNIKFEYNRKCNETPGVITAISKAQNFFRNCVINAGNTMSLNGTLFREIICTVIDTIAANTRLYIKIEYNRKCTQAMKIKTYISKTQSFFRRCRFNAGSNMWLNGAGKNKQISSLIERIMANSRLIVIKGMSARINDRVKAEGVVKRKLSVFLRIMTNSIARSFINKRFLSAKVEITLKSRIGETNFNEQ